MAKSREAERCAVAMRCTHHGCPFPQAQYASYANMSGSSVSDVTVLVSIVREYNEIVVDSCSTGPTDL